MIKMVGLMHLHSFLRVEGKARLTDRIVKIHDMGCHVEFQVDHSYGMVTMTIHPIVDFNSFGFTSVFWRKEMKLNTNLLIIFSAILTCYIKTNK